MPLLRSKTPARPDELLDELRAAQAQHADAIASANGDLVAAHNDILVNASSRRETLAEQIDLLRAEHRGLGPVVDAAASPKVVPATQ